jgi:TP53 regulating kinase and related kinases
MNTQKNLKKNNKILSQGAEAKIILQNNSIIKNRIKKTYRHPELDEKLRKRRTKSESKLLEKASKIINVPSPKITHLGPKEFSIVIPFINGKKLSESFDEFSKKEQQKICKDIGESVAKLHKNEIIHGDLTTSNMILVKDKNKNFEVYFIDFGLGYISTKIEDKAVDLHLLTQALESKHFKNWEFLLKEIFKSYQKIIGKEYSEKIFQRINKIEKRGRYKH